MKNHKELYEALLKGETLVADHGYYSVEWYLDAKGQSYVKHSDAVYAVPEELIIPGAWKIKPKTININGVEVHGPCREPLAKGVAYYVPSLISPQGLCSVYYWDNRDAEYELLAAGLVHLTAEAAIKHAEALLSFTRKEV